ncbi:probable serine/threonine-protein kinase cdc7 isoform X1 [Culex pipiens pallens]|uniref:probable serine/threonine-protein kinase cdc7 isoform X1 n=1 Tax=Culex pipiens pallens TaxID=42434 RepID=UPI001954C02D|nr:probable serine/threonine-protein kinase cdc7 isoform X1 [Culex pipiens pallens]
MEKSFDEITVSSLSDLQLGSSSEYPSHLAPGSSGGGDQQQVQQRNSGSGAGNGNENNLNRQKRSSKHQQQQQQQSVFNPSRHLDVWLANAIRGLENANSGGQDGAGSDLLDSPTLLKGSFGEPLSLPPNLGYLDAPNSSASTTTGLFSPTQQQLSQQQLQQQLQQSQQFLPNPYLHRYAGSFPSSEGIEFASLPPRISHNNSSSSNSQYQQYQQGRRAMAGQGVATHQSNSSFQDLLNAQRIMTDPYINDSSDNESKNGGSCNTKSKLESAEALLADLNLLNSASSANATNSINNGPTGTTNGTNGLNGTSTGNNSTSTNTNNSNGNANNNNNLVLVLLKEISKLHETNKKICRNLHETKVEMEALKHAPHWGLSHRRDSISGLSTNSQPIVGHVRYNSGNSFGGGGGLQSPAPTYHSQGNYTPGIVSDVVREIREVSRVREEALMDRMKTLIEERSWAVNETNFRLLKETEEMKKSIHSVRSEMHQVMDRMLKLENEVITLKGQLAHYQQREQVQAFALRERDSYQGLGLAPSSAGSAKFRRNSMHLNYGRINSTDEFYGNNNFNDVSNELRFSNGSNSAAAPTAGPTTRAGNSSKFGENNFATSSVVNGGGFGGQEDMNVMHDDGSNSSEANHQVLLLEKDALKLRRELQDALASKQESESRISALESIVSTLKEQVPPAALTTASTAQQHHHHSQLLLTTNPAGLGGTTSSSSSNYFRALNSGSPQQPPVSVSPKLQKAAQVQSLASPSTQQERHQQQHQQFQQRFLEHGTMPGVVMNVSGPVTDL